MRKQFSDTTPAPPSGADNVRWQHDGAPTDPTTWQKYSAYVMRGGPGNDSSDVLVNGAPELSWFLNGVAIGSAAGVSVNQIPGTEIFLNGEGMP
jgi:hypothetical protein